MITKRADFFMATFVPQGFWYKNEDKSIVALPIRLNRKMNIWKLRLLIIEYFTENQIQV